MAGFPCVVDDKSLGKNLVGPFLKNLERLIDGDPRGKNAGDLGGVQLLEAVDLTRFGASLQFGKSGELEELIVGAAHINGTELIGVETVLPLELRDHLVAASLDAEAVHIVAAEQRAEIGPHLLKIKAESRYLVAVEGDLHLGHVIFEIAVGKDENAAPEGRLHKVIGSFKQTARFGRRGDDKFHGEVTPSG